MRIAKVPLRVSLFGGGTDYPTYADEFGGMVIGGTIDKYVYAMLSKLGPGSGEEYRVTYREHDSVNSIDAINHPIVRQVFKDFSLPAGYAFHTVSDIPGGTGLGSSSSFALAASLVVSNEMQCMITDQIELARYLIDLEQNKLGEPVGYQDQCHAVIGGFRPYYFHQEIAYGQCISDAVLRELEKRSILVFTGNTRKAIDVLSDQNVRNQSKLNNHYLDQMKHIAQCALDNFMSNTDVEKILDNIARLLSESWMLKTKLSTKIMNPAIQSLVDDITQLNNTSFKLLGAGGGGFIYILTTRENIKLIRTRYGKKAIDIKFTNTGGHICYDD